MVQDLLPEKNDNYCTVKHYIIKIVFIQRINKLFLFFLLKDIKI